MEAALEIRNLCKHFDKFDLEGVSFTLPKGYVMGFIGENGAGKSVTIKLIMDLLKKDSGDIKVLGKELTSENTQLKESVGVVMDECCFPDVLNAGDVNRIVKSIYKTWDEKKFFDYLNTFELDKSKMIKEYSRGMKMKLSIAVALSHDSKLLILDEATSGLDPVVRDEILDIFLEYMQDESHSIFISSHIISDLEKICDYITFIHKGKILFSEAKDDLAAKYGIIRCAKDEIGNIDKEAVIGVRYNQFGAEALVKREKAGVDTEPASIEEIMIYYSKEGK